VRQRQPGVQREERDFDREAAEERDEEQRLLAGERPLSVESMARSNETTGECVSAAPQGQIHDAREGDDAADKV